MTQLIGQHDAADPKAVITTIEKSGFNVFISHGRYPDGLTYPIASAFNIKQMGFTPDPKGGLTTVTIVDKDGNLVASGSSVCSRRDNFDRKLGTRIALGRALKGLET